MTIIAFEPKRSPATSPVNTSAMPWLNTGHDLKLLFKMRLTPMPGVNVFDNDGMNLLLENSKHALQRLSANVHQSLLMSHISSPYFDEIARQHNCTSVVMNIGEEDIAFDEGKIRYAMIQFSYRSRLFITALLKADWNAMPFVSAVALNGFKPNHDKRMSLARLGLGIDSH